MRESYINKFDGWLGINKEVGMSSAKVVYKVKKLMKLKKAGHAGTLDPLASGVLPIALGEATKTMSYAMQTYKAYEFDINWGVATETDDLEGKISNISKVRPSKNEIIGALPNFMGNIRQKPPIFSAIKIDGIRSYKLARKSIIVDIPEREVFIKSFKLVKSFDKNKARFIVECGKGVYIRSLARDLANCLNTYGHISYLKRLSVGTFLYKDAILLADLANLVDKATISEVIKPISFVLDDIPAIDINSDEAILISRGQKIYKEGIELEEGKYYKEAFITSNGTPIALAKLEGKYIIPFRVFNN
ncbi:MAG: tRNA pseudouridine(55) synthase TruB [Alphaproteobacteria bacterium]|nr:tRNA pseudouridine(55) synthase TruB [Alphaproteobacteria bacterium]